MTATLDLLRKRLAHPEGGGDPAILRRFAQALFDRADEAFLDTFDGDAMYAMAADGLELLRSFTDGAVRVEVYNPSFESDGWESPHTVIRLLLVDRPFIVDSVQAELRRKGFELVHQLHPILKVLRSESGALLDIDGADFNRREAFEMFFIERVDEAEVLERIASAMKQVLGDVILATDDYAALKRRSAEVATYLRGLAAGGVRPVVTAPEGPSENPVTAEELEEYAAFMEWLDDDNFIYLGYREYGIVERGGETSLAVVRGSGLGILRKVQESAYRRPVPLKSMPTQLRERVTGGRIFIVTKTNAEATVHRARRMDYIGIKKLSAKGEVLGERRFVGLLTSKAQNTSVEDIPILRSKLSQVLQLDDAVPGSHDYKAIVEVFNSTPREELFSTEAEQLHHDIRAIMGLEQERSARLRLRADPLKRGISAMVIMPRESFNAEVRRAVQAFLQERLRARRVDYRLAISEDQSLARFHFYFTTDIDPGSIDVRDLERTIRQLARSWQEEMRERLVEQHGEREGRILAQRYEGAFDDSYRTDVTPSQAVRDIENLEKLAVQKRVFDLVNPAGDASASLLTIYHFNHGLALSDVLPLLENLGFRVVEQYPYNLIFQGEHLGIDKFRVQSETGRPLDVRYGRERLLEALRLVFSGAIENDRLNRLVLYAALSARQVALVRAYRMYYSQLNQLTSRAFVATALLAHPSVARLLVELFEAKFDPQLAADLPGGREAAVAGARERVLDALAEVSSLAEDQVLRGLLDLIDATVRTNYYLGYERISFKLRSAAVGSMPDPRPMFEIAVSSPGVDGTHLRGGKVARGGLRWSDRPDDFRTEVLGLMKTQMTKNAVIVPVGSKGGFVLKGAPDGPALRDYVKDQYQVYIRGLLDLTDNLVNGAAVHPARVLCYDETDPYLVVAADKGTASFSDLANATAREYDFWLGDAFASGGSAGYDHKGMGITARGAWECIKRLFAELGRSVFTEPFSVVGIGDMSGDVFGNGMLYSDRIKLQAAFNHQHIFIDPDPDLAASFAERRRLFELPRSSWRDYDVKLISAGGGVFERSAKSIPLSAEMRAMLGVEAEALSGPGLIRAVLMMPVDLLFNGGIGTYVKASSERHAEVGDSANDTVRVDATQLRCRVIGEGGNLGLTQLARIEFARAGGRLDTDAIHNSAGVDTSDHEVNIKVLLQPLVATGELGEEQRLSLLREMTDEVAALVLRNNDRQSLALSLAERAGKADIGLYASLLDYLVESAGLNPRVEYLPTARQLDERRLGGEGFTRPELAVMLAYVKMGLYRRLLETDLPDEPFLQHYLRDYFPAVLRQRMPAQLAAHQLRREITATQITNTIVDLLGIAFVHRSMRENGAGAVEVVRAALIALELLGAHEFVARLDQRGDELPPEAAYSALSALTSAVDGIVSWLLYHAMEECQVEGVVARHGAALLSLKQGLEELLPTAEKRRYRNAVKAALKQGHDELTAAEIASLDYLPTSIGVTDVALATGTELGEAARRFYAIGDRLSLGWLRDALAELPTPTRWDKQAVTGLIMDLREAQEHLATAFVSARKQEEQLGIEEFLRRDATFKRYDEAMKELKLPGELTLASAAVLARMLAQSQLG